eukprot:4051461-Pyramimonas_sp.AAC.1
MVELAHDHHWSLHVLTCMVSLFPRGQSRRRCPATWLFPQRCPTPQRAGRKAGQMALLSPQIEASPAA